MAVRDNPGPSEQSTTTPRNSFESRRVVDPCSDGANVSPTRRRNPGPSYQGSKTRLRHVALAPSYSVVGSTPFLAFRRNFNCGGLATRRRKTHLWPTHNPSRLLVTDPFRGPVSFHAPLAQHIPTPIATCPLLAVGDRTWGMRVTAHLGQPVHVAPSIHACVCHLAPRSERLPAQDRIVARMDANPCTWTYRVTRGGWISTARGVQATTRAHSRADAGSPRGRLGMLVLSADTASAAD